MPNCAQDGTRYLPNGVAETLRHQKVNICSSVLLPNLSVACIVKRNGRLPATAFGIPLSYGRRANNQVGRLNLCLTAIGSHDGT